MQDSRQPLKRSLQRARKSQSSSDTEKSSPRSLAYHDGRHAEGGAVDSCASFGSVLKHIGTRARCRPFLKSKERSARARRESFSRWRAHLWLHQACPLLKIHPHHMSSFASFLLAACSPFPRLNPSNFSSTLMSTFGLDRSFRSASFASFSLSASSFSLLVASSSSVS